MFAPRHSLDLKPEPYCSSFVAVMLVPRMSAAFLARAFMNTADREKRSNQG